MKKIQLGATVCLPMDFHYLIGSLTRDIYGPQQFDIPDCIEFSDLGATLVHKLPYKGIACHLLSLFRGACANGSKNGEKQPQVHVKSTQIIQSN